MRVCKNFLSYQNDLSMYYESVIQYIYRRITPVDVKAIKINHNSVRSVQKNDNTSSGQAPLKSILFKLKLARSFQVQKGTTRRSPSSYYALVKQCSGGEKSWRIVMQKRPSLSIKRSKWNKTNVSALQNVFTQWALQCHQRTFLLSLILKEIGDMMGDNQS